MVIYSFASDSPTPQNQLLQYMLMFSWWFMAFKNLCRVATRTFNHTREWFMIVSRSHTFVFVKLYVCTQQAISCMLNKFQTTDNQREKSWYTSMYMYLLDEVWEWDQFLTTSLYCGVLIHHILILQVTCQCIVSDQKQQASVCTRPSGLLFPFLLGLTRDGGVVSWRLLWWPELWGGGGRRGKLCELGGRGRSLLRVCIIGHWARSCVWEG